MIHPTAIIGEAPEHRDWLPPDGMPLPLIHSAARIEALVTVDAGISRPTMVLRGAFLMKKVHVGHDAIIGAGAELAPMTSVGGHVIIGNDVKVGQGATFKPYVRVGDGARIGMGAVVTKNVPAGAVWAGNPAKPLGRHCHACGRKIDEAQGLP